MPKVKVNGINLYYEEYGQGEPLIFIPGLGGTTKLFFFQIPFFKEHFRVITFDNRGAGETDKPLGFYTMKMMAKDLNGLLDHLNIDEPIHLAGASMGGIIAQAFIKDYRERVKTLSLICSGVSGGDPHQTKSSDEILQKILNPGNTREEKIDTFLENFYYHKYVEQNPSLKDILLNLKIKPQPTYAYMSQLYACMDNRPYYEWLKEIDIPTLVMHGRQDLIWPLQNALTLKKGIGENCELSIIEEAGHMFFSEKPDEFNHILFEFLSQNKEIDFAGKPKETCTI